jgi:hypothetical protein
MLLALLPLMVAQLALAAEPKAAFTRVWERYDRPVTEGRSDRSWAWGPGQATDVLYEEFSREQGSSYRAVQYWDKGRMELTDPNVDPNHPWFVTSGLLPVELMFNRRQTGLNEHVVPRLPSGFGVAESYVAAIGDPLSFPAYPDLQPLYENPGTISAAELGKPVTVLFNPDLTISAYTAYASDPATFLVQGLNNHGVPRAFMDFMNQQGVVFADGRYSRQRVFDPLFIFGLPVTPAAWVTTRIGGNEKTVLFQVFERRVLTYSPTNAPAFRVEMGNVGQHYYKWRYTPADTQEWIYDGQPTPEVSYPSTPGARYILEVDWREVPSGAPAGQGPPPRKYAKYRIYFSPDGGQTRELRYSSAEFGGCYSVAVDLLAPRNLDAGTNRIGLLTQCVDNPSAARGVGVTIYSSYNGGRTFVKRFDY